MQKSMAGAPGRDLDHSRCDQSSNRVLAPAAVPPPSALAEHLAAVGGDHHGVLEFVEAAPWVEHRGLDREHHARLDVATDR